MEKSQSIKELSSALCKFQSEMGKIKKDANNPFYKSKYATLSNILDAITEPLTRNGLAVSQFPTGDNEMTTILMHVSGEFIQASYRMTPVKNDPQALGSAITYQRRYALGAVLGLNIDEDDDGNKAAGKQKPEQPKSQKIFNRSNDDLVNRLIDKINGTNLCGHNGKKEKWSLAQFECNLSGFTKEDYTWLLSKASETVKTYNNENSSTI